MKRGPAYEGLREAEKIARGLVSEWVALRKGLTGSRWSRWANRALIRQLDARISGGFAIQERLMDRQLALLSETQRAMLSEVPAP